MSALDVAVDVAAPEDRTLGCVSIAGSVSLLCGTCTGIFVILTKNLTRKSSGGHQAKRRKEEKTFARVGRGRHASVSHELLPK
jgi:hypothetical protein